MCLLQKVAHPAGATYSSSGGIRGGVTQPIKNTVVSSKSLNLLVCDQRWQISQFWTLIPTPASEFNSRNLVTIYVAYDYDHGREQHDAHDRSAGHQTIDEWH